MARRWFQRDVTDSSDESVVGRTGRVSGAIGPGLAGEVMIAIRGGTEAFTAYPLLSGETFASGDLVVVVDYIEPRIVYVSAAR